MSNLAKGGRFPAYATRGQKCWHYFFIGLCVLVFIYLMAPVLVVIPLAFNAEPYFTYPINAFSLRWFDAFFNDVVWRIAVRNSFIVGSGATLIATALGTLAAIGLSRKSLPFKAVITAVLVSPMIVPVVITAVGAYLFYSTIGLANSLTGIMLAHAALGVPFVIITVTATLTGFDPALLRAARNLGAGPARAFFKVMLPVIWPGLFSGALFAFATSFDEVVIVLFLGGVEQRTVPRQMWTGLREQLSPTILAVAVMLIIISMLMLITLELLRQRSMRMRGIKE